MLNPSMSDEHEQVCEHATMFLGAVRSRAPCLAADTTIFVFANMVVLVGRVHGRVDVSANLYLYLYLSISVSLSLSLYIYVYIYVYIYRDRERET